jgi:hypothetical protein
MAVMDRVTVVTQGPSRSRLAIGHIIEAPVIGRAAPITCGSRGIGRAGAFGFAATMF